MVQEYCEHWANLFMAEFAKESDRACVILSVAMLEQVLEDLIKGRLVPTGSPEDSLLEGVYAPISTFNAKIELAHRLGLISTKFCRDLHIIRKIRNDFAHNIQGCSFEDSSARSRIVQLVHSSGFADRFPPIRKIYMEGTKGDFQMTVSWMLWALTQLSLRVSAIEPAGEEWGYCTEDEVDEVLEKDK